MKPTAKIYLCNIENKKILKSAVLLKYEVGMIDRKYRI